MKNIQITVNLTNQTDFWCLCCYLCHQKIEFLKCTRNKCMLRRNQKRKKTFCWWYLAPFYKPFFLCVAKRKIEFQSSSCVSQTNNRPWAYYKTHHNKMFWEGGVVMPTSNQKEIIFFIVLQKRSAASACATDRFSFFDECYYFWLFIEFLFKFGCVEPIYSKYVIYLFFFNKIYVDWVSLASKSIRLNCCFM